MPETVEAGRGTAPYVPLPAGVPGIVRERARGLFDGVAQLYDEARPGYPLPVIDHLASVCGLDATTRVLEVGCGTGQLSRQLAPLVGELHCVEVGRDLAASASRNLQGHANVAVINVAFEDHAISDLSFDVVVSATAFHWIDPSVGYPKAARILAEHGSLALLTHAHAAEGSHEEIADVVAGAHSKHAPELGPWAFPSTADIEAAAHVGGDIASVWARVERHFHRVPDVTELFADTSVFTYAWTATYSTAQFIALLGTQSPYLSLPAERRRTLFDVIADAVERRLHGRITKRYVTVLAAAKKQSAR